jgi:hypothetical protein
MSKENQPPVDPFLQSPVSLRSDDKVIFVIYKQGQFGHGIHGIDMNRDNAIALAKEAAKRDVDDYHSYDVYPVPHGRLPDSNSNPMADYGWMNMEPIYTAVKSKIR